MRLLLFLTLLLSLPLSPGHAQPAKQLAPNAAVDAAPSNPQVDVIRKVAQARQLNHAGLTARNAIPLIDAARIFRQIAPFDSKAPARIKAQPRFMAMSKLFNNSVKLNLDLATKFAAGKDKARALIDEVAKMPALEPAGRSYVDVGRGKSAIEIWFRLAAGKRSAIFVDTPQAKEVSGLAVFDDNGNLICANRKRLPMLLCEWTLVRNGDFRLHVSNTTGEDQIIVLIAD
jgi:hypothetical protein